MRLREALEKTAFIMRILHCLLHTSLEPVEYEIVSDLEIGSMFCDLFELIVRIEGKQGIRWDRGRLRRLQGAVGWREGCRYD
jgi:hypothetical protein